LPLCSAICYYTGRRDATCRITAEARARPYSSITPSSRGRFLRAFVPMKGSQGVVTLYWPAQPVKDAEQF
jgi:hypothetical protein